MNVLLLSRYTNLGASSRLRFLQYLPYLESVGIRVTVAPLLDDKYLSSLYMQKRKNIVDITISYLDRLAILFKSANYNVVYIEKELFPWLPSLFERLLNYVGIPYIVDYDDAIFHAYDRHKYALVRCVMGQKIDVIMRHAALVIVGNQYLARRAREAGARRIEVLPTVIDLDRYTSGGQKNHGCFTVGWVGTPITERYLNLVQPALAKLCATIDKIKVILVGAQYVKLHGIPVQFRAWSKDKEVADIHDFDVGIMPLPDEPWEHGKCGYKLIQYMACAKPVVASPIGINKEIVEHGKNGFLASTKEEWFDALMTLYLNNSLKTSMGWEGRKKIERQYCLQVTSSRLASLLNSVGKH